MGFSGGGSNVLLPHTHDGTVSQDGGPLDCDGVTQAGLAVGDVIFSDGVHLQRLAIGTPAQQIQVNAGATAPEYFTPAAGASVWTELVNTTLGAAGPLNGSWVGHYDILSVYIFSQPDGANVTGIDFNSDDGTNYNGATTSSSWVNERSSDIYGSAAAALTNFNWTHIWIYNNADKRKLYYIDTTTDTGAGSAPALWQSWGQWENTADSISSLQVVCRNSGASIDFKSESHLLILGAN